MDNEFIKVARHERWAELILNRPEIIRHVEVIGMTVHAGRRPGRTGWPLITLAWTYAVAFAAAVVVYQVARALGG